MTECQTLGQTEIAPKDGLAPSSSSSSTLSSESSTHPSTAPSTNPSFSTHHVFPSSRTQPAPKILGKLNVHTNQFPYFIWEPDYYFEGGGLLSIEVFGLNANRYNPDFPRSRGSKKKATAAAKRRAAKGQQPQAAEGVEEEPDEDPDEIHRLRAAAPAFLTVANSQYQCVVLPPDFPRFLQIHRACTFVTFQVADQFWSVVQLLEDLGAAAELKLWWETCNGGRVRDSCLLDQLIHLATIDAQPTPMGFSTLVESYAKVDLPPRSTLPYHRKFRSLLGAFRARALAGHAGPHLTRADLEALPREFFKHALRYVAFNFFVYQRMCIQAVQLMEQYSPEMLHNALIDYGPLSEVIQVKGEISLSQVTRNGVCVDVAMAQSMREHLSAELQKSTLSLLDMLGEWRTKLTAPDAPSPSASSKEPIDDAIFDLFHLDRFGNIKISKISGKPSLIHSSLEALLQLACQEVQEITRTPIVIPLVPETASMSLSTKEWAKHAMKHPFIASWIDMEQAAKLYTFIGELTSSRVHPKYTLMVRNGRASCFDPNIQQIPRKRGFRDVFLASPGHVFLFVDYSFIELCTLAAVCESRYGRSMLANVIREGIDPHSFTAAMLQSISLKTFLKMQDDPDPEQREKFRVWRQRAKAINFGIPGGQGAAALREYAASAYGVELTHEQARDFRTKITQQIFPELHQYLHEDRRFMQVLSMRLAISPVTCWEAFRNLTIERSSAVAGAVRNVIRGVPYDTAGNPYPSEFVQGVWDVLVKINQNPDLDNLLAMHKMHGNEDIEGKLFGIDVTTLTGRIRGGVTFTQACNTPFSGLAADGAKLAIWNLTQIGYKIVGFVHDELLIELPQDSNFDAEAALIEHVMCASMADLTGSVPVMTKATLAHRWSREAVAVFDENNRMVPWQSEAD